MLEHFKNYLEKEKRYSSHTVLAYIEDIKQAFIIMNLNPSDRNHLSELNPPLIRSYVVQALKSGLDPRSVNRKLSSCRAYYRFLMTQNVVSQSPFSGIKGPKVSKRLPDFIQKQELMTPKTELLFTNDLFGCRDRLMFELLYQTGMRLSELIGLKEQDVSKNGIRVLGKRNKERIVAIGDQLDKDIFDFVKLKHASGLNLDYLLFTDSGKKMYPKFVYRKINFYLSAITTVNKKSPHVMRHTFATHMLNEGVGIEVLKEILGHANLAATQVYTHNSFEQINTIYKSAHPRGRKT
jgi:integrase/recombinase XerC